MRHNSECHASRLGSARHAYNIKRVIGVSIVIDMYFLQTLQVRYVNYHKARLPMKQGHVGQ